MSFYGNVFYEFKNLFQKFKFLNNGQNNQSVDFPYDSSTVNGTIATQNWDTLHIETGNRWIGLKKLPEDGNFKGVTIFHAGPGNDTTNKPTFTPVVGNDGEKLKADQKFTTAVFKVDNAGHIYDVQEHAYQLPSSSEMVEAGLKTYYNVSEINQDCIVTETDSEEGVTELQPGQELDVLKLKITNKGILSGFSTKTYKLPMSDTEKDYSELQDRVSIAEDTLEQLVASIPETYATIESVGSVDDFYVNAEEQETKFENIAQGIGNLENSSKIIVGDDSVVSVSEQLIMLYEIIAQKTAEVATFAAAIEGLQARVRLLESQMAELTAQTE